MLNIGADPELVCIREGVFVRADEYFNSEGGFGCDGNSSIGEIRPGWHSSPVQVVTKIRKLLKTVSRDVPELDYLAGGYKHGCSIGGHIHFSADFPLPISTMVWWLDIYHKCLSDLIDPIKEREQRLKTGYGQKGAYETKNSSHFEYRTPISWIISPVVAMVNLSLAKAIGEIVVSKQAKYLEGDEPYYNEDKLTKLTRLTEMRGLSYEIKQGIKLIPLLVENKPKWNEPILQFWV